MFVRAVLLIGAREARLRATCNVQRAQDEQCAFQSSYCCFGTSFCQSTSTVAQETWSDFREMYLVLIYLFCVVYNHFFKQMILGCIGTYFMSIIFFLLFLHVSLKYMRHAMDLSNHLILDNRMVVILEKTFLSTLIYIYLCYLSM